ncbi:hypothetical protein Tco_1436628 [Tanacetum coccineum]
MQETSWPTWALQQLAMMKGRSSKRKESKANSDTQEDDISSTNAHENKLSNMVRRGEEVKEQGKEEDEMEIDMEIKEVIKDEESKIETDEEVEEIFEEERMVMFKENDEKITFKMPNTMEIFKQTKLLGLNTDSIPPSAYKKLWPWKYALLPKLINQR